MEKVNAWYFSQENRKLLYGDDRLIFPGETHYVDCSQKACNVGLHASVNIIDALTHAPGPIIWRVELHGEMDFNNDKIDATHRKYIWGADASACLREFARKCALDVIDLWKAPKIVITYLKTGDESLRASARASAWAAARDASGDAAWAAARASAWAAARDASGDAAWAASKSATRSDTRASAREKQEKRLLEMIRKLPRFTS